MSSKQQESYINSTEFREKTNVLFWKVKKKKERKKERKQQNIRVMLGIINDA